MFSCFCSSEFNQARKTTMSPGAECTFSRKQPKLSSQDPIRFFSSNPLVPSIYTKCVYFTQQPLTSRTCSRLFIIISIIVCHWCAVTVVDPAYVHVLSVNQKTQSLTQKHCFRHVYLLPALCDVKASLNIDGN